MEQQESLTTYDMADLSMRHCTAVAVKDQCIITLVSTNS